MVLHVPCMIHMSNIAENSLLVDMGAGVGKAMWHAAVAMQSKRGPQGAEVSLQLVEAAEQIAGHIENSLSASAAKDGWQLKSPLVIQYLLMGQLTVSCGTGTQRSYSVS